MASETKVTRIKAKDTQKAPAVKAKVIKPKKEKKEKRAPKTARNPFVKFLVRIGEYFTGAWYELRQVRWPTRGATWSLTLAVILFSAFFTGLIILLDLGFKSLFELILI